MTGTSDVPRRLWGRGAQCAVLDALLAEVRAGRSRALVVRGEPGIGKTALLHYAADAAQDFRVARAGGVESEMELPFAALHQLCGPLLTRLDRLPGQQRDALGVAFGLRSGGAPDRFVVGLAVLGLLSEVAAERPLLCLVDDAQWLDQASARTLAFVACRLDAESVAVVFGARDPGAADYLADLPVQALAGLSEADARALLASAIPGPLDERVRDRVVAESGGNPLALLEFARGGMAAELSGGFADPGVQALSGRIEDSFLHRLESLPATARRLLLLAAVEPTGDPALLWRAAGKPGVGAAARKAAESGGLLEFGARVTFRHPLVRSAVYRSASPDQRRQAHRALAEATDPRLDPDRHAWHLAQATLGPDEDVAAELERSAGRAQARGGFAAAAAFLERSVALTPEPRRRGARALVAAQAKFDAAAPDRAYALLATAQAAPLDELQRARVDVLRAQIVLAQGRGGDASALMLAAAERLEPLDAGQARETYLEAFGATLFAGRLGGAVGVRQVAEAARGARRVDASSPTGLDLLLDGLVTRFTEGYPASVAPLRRALDALRASLRVYGLVGREVRFAWGVSPELWDDEAWHELAGRGVQLARDAGALAALPVGLTYRAGLLVLAGEFATAAALIEEADAVAAATGIAHFDYTSPLLAALRGRETEALAVIDAGVRKAVARGEGRAIGHAEHAVAVLYNGLGRYGAALAAAQRACADEDLGVFGWGLAELVEAGARGGSPGVAVAALDRLAERTRAAATDWARGIEARSRALLSDGRTAEPFYREAIERLARSRIAVHLARAHLVYGEWLRRENRRADAREQLRAAHRMFIAMGAEGFAERTGRELQATGERLPGRATMAPARLTPRETQIARLAIEGRSNPEIAAQLFMSRRTVEYHLHKIFTKLDIGSRNQLHVALPTNGPGCD